MKLDVGPCWTRFQVDSNAEADWLSSYLSREVSDFDTGATGWQSVISGDRFPSGLTRVVMRAAQAQSFSVTARLTAAPLAVQPDFDQMLPDTRDYQAEAVRRAVTARRGLVKVPTGGGKTRVCFNIARSLGELIWLYAVHRPDVAEQVDSEFAKLCNERAGTVSTEGWERGTSNFSIVTFSQLHALYRRAMKGDQEAHAVLHALATEVQGLLVDECHTTSAPTHFEALQRIPAPYRIGVSGTPLHRGELENLFIIGALGPLVYEVSRETLVESEHVAQARIHMLEVPGPTNWPEGTWNWRAVYNRGIVANGRRARAVAEKAQAAPKPALVFVEEIKHGKNQLAALLQVGARAEFVWGSASLGQRKEALQRLKRGETEVLVCNDIFREGIDVPEIRTVVNAAGKKSPVALLQRLGRALRAKVGENFDQENTCDVWDVYDTCHPWIKTHADQRLFIYEQEGYNVEVVKP